MEKTPTTTSLVAQLLKQVTAIDAGISRKALKISTKNFIADLHLPVEHFTAMIWKASKILGIGMARSTDFKKVRRQLK